jgi:nucleotide-binding universal stress UspA family protein
LPLKSWPTPDHRRTPQEASSSSTGTASRIKSKALISERIWLPTGQYRVKRIPLGDIDVGDVLLSHAADAEIDFIVMGGYGHSRLREFVLGGVTRSMLRTMTAPVLMSH